MKAHIAIPLASGVEYLVEVAKQEDLEFLRSELEYLRDEVRQLREQLTAFHGDPHP